MANFKKIEKTLFTNGWRCVRINGSHYQYKHPDISGTITVPNHNGKDLSIGVVKNLEKLTGLSF